MSEIIGQEQASGATPGTGKRKIYPKTDGWYEMDDAGVETGPFGPVGGGYTDEAAQDAVGGMVGASLVYDDVTPKLSRAALTGDVTASEDSNATTIANDAVTNAKLANMADGTLKGRALGAGTGDPTDLTPTQGRAILNVADGANNYVHPNHSGDVTSVADGAQTIANDAVSNAKLANMAVSTIKGRVAAGTGDPEDLTASQARDVLDVEPDGSTLEISGGNMRIKDAGVTLAKLANIPTNSLIGRDTAASGVPESILLDDTLEMDGALNLQRAALTGDVTAAAGSNTTAIDKTAITGKTLVTAASGDHVLVADASDSDNLKKVNVSDFMGGGYSDEQAQDAVGAMVADTPTIDITYTDVTPELKADVKPNSIDVTLMHATATDKLFGRSTAGAGAGEEIPLTAAGRAIIDDADAAAQRATLGLGNIAQLDYDAFTQDFIPATDQTLLLGSPGGPGKYWLAAFVQKHVFKKVASISNPLAADLSLWAKTDDSFYKQVNAGTVTKMLDAADIASTTNVLTGTSASVVVSPDALAALWEAGSDISDGATITIGEGGYFNLITSTTAITAISITTDKVGRTFRLRFNTARTLTHNATSLILPTGANITTVAGDICQVRSLGSGNVVVEWYTRGDGTPLAIVAASLTVAGKVELATTAEIDTGTDSSRAMPVDQFVASARNVRYFLIRVVDSATDVATGTTKGGDVEVPFTGTITEIGAYVDTAGTTGTMTVDVNKNGTTIMTTNKITIDTAEKSSRTAATAPALTTTAISAGDLITIDIDAIHTTAAKGLTVRIGIRMT